MLTAGDVVAGRYRVEGLLGQGGMAAVYKARHLVTESRCALKVVHAHLVSRPGQLELFLREARVEARIGKSPFIVDVYDAGVDEERKAPFLAMELLAGDTLRAIVERDGAISSEVMQELAPQLGAALDQAHRVGVIHRDLKPGNLFLTKDTAGKPTIKILDFGIAKLLDDEVQRTSTQVGTMAYAAPEQLGPTWRKAAEEKGIVIQKEISPATDVWALGLTVHDLLTGARPGAYWGVESMSELPLRVVLGEERILDQEGMPEAFRAWLTQCLQRDAAKRYQSAGEAMTALIEVLHGGAAPTPRVVDEPAPKSVKTSLRGSIGSYVPGQLPEAGSESATDAERVELAKKNPTLWVAAAVGVMLVAGLLAGISRCGAGRGGSGGAASRASAIGSTDSVSAPLTASIPASGSANPSRDVGPQPADWRCKLGDATWGQIDDRFRRALAKDMVAVCDPDEPRLALFLIGRTEVTVDAYGSCVECGPRSDCGNATTIDGPLAANCMDQASASTFCEWRYGGKLPTWDQWRQANGTRTTKTPRAACSSRGQRGPCKPVSSDPPGALPVDLLGNVAEWGDRPDTSRDAGGQCTAFGGSFLSNGELSPNLGSVQWSLQCASRHRAVGFRCAWTPPAQ